MFDKFLKPNEKIVCLLHPHKQRFYFNFYLITALWALWLFVVAELVMLSFQISGGYYFIPLSIFVVAFLWAVPVSVVKYKKTAYAITEKQIIVCTGIFGVEYNSIELNKVFNINYKQNFCDRLIGNTATISVYSAPAVLGAAQTHHINLKFVKNPDESYRLLNNMLNKTKGE